MGHNGNFSTVLRGRAFSGGGYHWCFAGRFTFEEKHSKCPQGSIVNVSSGYLIRVLLGSDTAGQYVMVDYNKSDSSFLSAYEIPSHVFRRLYASYKGLVERTSGKVFSQKWLTFGWVYRKQIDADLYFIILGIRYSDPNFPDFLTAFDAYAFPDDSTHEIRPVLE
jgi:hypothetical protein